ncbi:PREDICTED: PRA1 family protein F3-like [Prunus mume]|uniref:PRA1 family protein n=1 Tax=Prunus mume TaxID=102107 RepID=A0ABM0NQI9_PRUMU|nr:PREDICTED: PRA1 family protein F3-like [Prunus mume]
MTTYGTIPTSSSTQGPSGEYISRAKERIKAGLGARRPWKLMFNFRSFNFPSPFREVFGRIRSNVAYFRMNYAIVMLLILFLSLLWHPISLIVFIIMMAAWLFLYFLRDEPLVLFGKTVDDRVVLIVLAVVTIVLLFLTHATVNILVALLIGVVLVVVHAGLRKTDDLFVDEENSGLLTTPAASSSST